MSKIVNVNIRWHGHNPALKYVSVQGENMNLVINAESIAVHFGRGCDEDSVRAAAWDLLDACKLALASSPFQTGRDQVSIDREAWELMRVAVARAEPRSSQE